MRFALLALLALPNLPLHDGPDPVARWLFRGRDLANGELRAQLGPNARVTGAPRVIPDALGESLLFDGSEDRLVVADDFAKSELRLPKKLITISAWASVLTARRWGGLVSALQDNGDAEKGWVLGYDDSSFYFGLATKGADDGDGKMTYLRGATPYELGKLYQVVATYDGETMSLYVNGKLDATSKEQTGPILYPKSAPFVLAGYKDSNEDIPHHGRVREISIYDTAAKSKWVAHEYDHFKQLAAAPPVWDPDAKFEFAVSPYLQFVTADGITVMWETTRPSTSRVRYGETDAVPMVVESDKPTLLHEMRLPKLKAQTGYFYRIESKSDDEVLESELRSFQTANRPESPFAFAIISDTQDNRPVAGVIANLAFAQRPNFVIVPGDLVGEGPNKRDWLDEFFPAMEPLISRVAFFPVLGNHERNARHYYEYVSLPEPEYHYTFRYGNAQFFMIDSNKEVGPKSAQYRWLDRELAKSTATWKFVAYHHPSYSSDENDYGDMWKGKSTNGDLRIRELCPLYDKHGVDIVWNGHIHSYERTWPLRKGAFDRDGTIYMITGGGGGSLETRGPIKPFFQNNVRRGHHYCMVSIAGKTLELRAFDIENRLFDQLRIEKR